MKKVYKYILYVADKIQLIELPPDAEILMIGMQGDEICIWAEVSGDLALNSRMFRVFETGHEIPEGMGISYDHVGSVIDGGLVWHVYEYSGI